MARQTDKERLAAAVAKAKAEIEKANAIRRRVAEKERASRKAAAAAIGDFMLRRLESDGASVMAFLRTEIATHASEKERSKLLAAITDVLGEKAHQGDARSPLEADSFSAVSDSELATAVPTNAELNGTGPQRLVIRCTVERISRVLRQQGLEFEFDSTRKGWIGEGTLADVTQRLGSLPVQVIPLSLDRRPELL